MQKSILYSKNGMGVMFSSLSAMVLGDSNLEIDVVSPLEKVHF